MKVHWKKSTNKSKGKPEQKFDAAVGIIFKISNVFNEARINFILIFLLNRPEKKYSTGYIIHLNNYIFYSTLLRFASHLVFFYF